MMGIRETVRAIQYDIAFMIAAEKYNKEDIATADARDEVRKQVEGVHEQYCSQYFKNQTGQQARKFSSLGAFKKFRQGI